MTNGERLRQMTDNELAAFLIDSCIVCAWYRVECEKHNKNCERGIIDWLKQEVDQNDSETV